MRLNIGLLLLCICTAYCQDVSKPLTQVQACRAFKNSIVQIDDDTPDGHGSGTGFIVGADGWIITALHVVADRQTLVPYSNITARIHSMTFPAVIVSPINPITSAQDVAVLKIEKMENLESLEFGSELGIEDGSPIVIIGLPLSASGIPRGTAVPPFCLSGTVAAQSALRLEGIQFRHTIYFQGVSVKGISGAPVISLDTKKVIGIANTKLTGIGPALEEQRNGLRHPSANMGGGFDLVKTLNGLVDVLDDQLANGLGSATGASDAQNILIAAQKSYSRQHARK